jgi:uncharacterized protein
MCKSKEVLRQCLACRESFDRKLLIRILQDNVTGTYFVNPDKFKFGRSVYVCRTENCISRFLKHKKYKGKFTAQEINGNN